MPCKRNWVLKKLEGVLKSLYPVAKISEYQAPNDQNSLNDQKMYAKQLGQLFFSKISYTLQ